MNKMEPKARELCNGQPFPKDVVAVLDSFYERGMTGWGQKHSSSLDEVMEITGLSNSQLKNWIRRKNMKRKAIEIEGDEENALPISKRRTPWVHYLKKFAQSNEGRNAIAKNPGELNKRASVKYATLSLEERMKLDGEIENEPLHKLTKREVVRCGERIFKKMDKLFNDLDELGYYGFSIGFYGNKTELVGTRRTLTCFDCQLIEYLHAKILAANPPPVDNQLPPHSRSTALSSINPPPSKSTPLSGVKTPTSSSKVASKVKTPPSGSRVNAPPSTSKVASKVNAPPSTSMVISKVNAMPSSSKVNTSPSTSKVTSKVNALPSTSVVISKVNATPSSSKVASKVNAPPSTSMVTSKVNAPPSTSMVISKVNALPSTSLVASKVNAPPSTSEVDKPPSSAEANVPLSASTIKTQSSVSSLRSNEAPIVINSSSPLKADPNECLKTPYLFRSDLEALVGERYLTCRLIDGCMELLKGVNEKIRLVLYWPHFLCYITHTEDGSR